MKKTYRVALTAEERGELRGMLARGKADVRALKHAQILLEADEAKGGPGWGDGRITWTTCSTSTITHTPPSGRWSVSTRRSSI